MQMHRDSDIYNSRGTEHTKKCPNSMELRYVYLVILSFGFLTFH